jgi:hypothetical protein
MYLRKEWSGKNRSLSFDKVSELLMESEGDEEDNRLMRNVDQDFFACGNRCRSVDFLNRNEGMHCEVKDHSHGEPSLEGGDHFIASFNEHDEHNLLLSRNFHNDSYDSLDPSEDHVMSGENSPAWSSVVNPLIHVPKTSVKASIFSLVASMVGGGTLSIPFAFQGAGYAILLLFYHF